jgi:phthalate 4,5-cis-dihydrodiol dehydrogenase
MCGLGSFSVVIANTIERSSKVELVTCYDVDPQQMDRTSERYGCAQERFYEDMVRRDDLDGIVIVSPNMFHREQTELAASHGKHVHVEKLIANTLEDGLHMIEACEAAGVTLLIGHVHRRHAVNRKVKYDDCTTPV